MKTFTLSSNMPIFPIDAESRKGDYKVKVQALEVSDGYHTFSELYRHRYALFAALCKIYDGYITPLNCRIKCWKSKLHSDGTMFENSFIVGMTVKYPSFSPEETTKFEHITYHLPLEWWDKFDLMEYEKAPEWDGHTSEDVIERLLRL